jgi:hypothetical protein
MLVGWENVKMRRKNRNGEGMGRDGAFAFNMTQPNSQTMQFSAVHVLPKSSTAQR